jgi:ubiquitin-protein ligase
LNGGFANTFVPLFALQAVKSSGIRLEPIGDSLFNLTGYVKGPPDTPYEGKVHVRLREGQPMV